MCNSVPWGRSVARCEDEVDSLHPRTSASSHPPHPHPRILASASSHSQNSPRKSEPAARPAVKTSLNRYKQVKLHGICNIVTLSRPPIRSLCHLCLFRVIRFVLYVLGETRSITPPSDSDSFVAS